jgi:hypothetical protein
MNEREWLMIDIEELDQYATPKFGTVTYEG